MAREALQVFKTQVNSVKVKGWRHLIKVPPGQQVHAATRYRRTWRALKAPAARVAGFMRRNRENGKTY